MTRQQSLIGEHGFAFSQLSSNEQRAYLSMYEAISKCRRITLEAFPGMSGMAISRILACIDMDHPELFWMDGYQSKRALFENTLNLLQDDAVFDQTLSAMETGSDYDGDGKVSFAERQIAAGSAALDANPLLAWSIKDSLALSPFWNSIRIKRTQKRFEGYLRGCKDLVSDDMDDYQVYRRVFEYVVRHTSYSFQKAKKSQDVRSVFVERESVCKGYAEALQYLLLGFGIPCFNVQGISESFSEARGAHAWNYVMIDGVWNIADVTAGDWDLDRHPERMRHIPDDIRDAFVDYRYMSMDGSGYKPANFVAYPNVGSTGDYFEREGYTLYPEAWHELVGICSRLHRRDEQYIQVRCKGDYAEIENWIRSAFSTAVRMCVAASRFPEGSRSFDAALLEEAKLLSRNDVAEAGWGDFKLKIHQISPKRDVFLLTSSGRLREIPST